ncbi:DUF2586 domain-containing protein [Oceanobacter mangrovi]|uniref:DUF2586 domain-containing protein n=1 Tax=Oceanobacter mangrovi TaxID=2862510 RepID=UPI001C8DBA28|nr:DUF2586 domain-containing protein [Oceanobacter mangrovi]
MPAPSISIIQQNLNQGGNSDVERRPLFIGLNQENANDAATVTDAGAVHTIGKTTDLDAILGAADSNLKTQIEAARANVGSTWTAYVVPLYSALGTGDIGVPFSDWDVALELALGQPNNIKPELVALTDEVGTDDLEDMQLAADNAAATWAKLITIHAPVAGNDGSQTWADYITATKAINAGVLFDRVHLVPQLHTTNLGAVIGRLTTETASIADSPMRVKTGVVLGLQDAPLDADGVALELDHIKELSEARFSVPYWYPDLTGMYWCDHMSLDDLTGDYSVYENRRVVDYTARRIRPLMVGDVANRALNRSASSTAYHVQKYSQPIKDAAKGKVIGGEPVAGLVQPPVDGDVVITWDSSTEVVLAFTVAPKDSPKKLTGYITLDLNRVEA